MFFFLWINTRSGPRVGIKWPECISKSKRSFLVSFSRIDSDLVYGLSLLFFFVYSLRFWIVTSTRSKLLSSILPSSFPDSCSLYIYIYIYHISDVRSVFFYSPLKFLSINGRRTQSKLYHFSTYVVLICHISDVRSVSFFYSPSKYFQIH